MLERISSALEVMLCSVVTEEYKTKGPALPIKGRDLVSVWSILGLKVPSCLFGTTKSALKKAGARFVRNFVVSQLKPICSEMQVLNLQLLLY